MYEGAGASGRGIATVDGSQVARVWTSCAASWPRRRHRSVKAWVASGVSSRLLTKSDREGAGSFGRIIATLDGNQVREGVTGFGA